MLKVAIFDDEYIVLQGLQSMIPWNEFGMEIVGTAEDGLTALELFKKEKPQLVMTDIRMPGMDGLELIKEILQMEPETYCIVFSGYNEFVYVKQAIQIGVSDYLEKPLEVEHIEEALKKAIRQIEKQLESQILKQKVEKSEQVLQERAIIELLKGSKQVTEEWMEQFDIEMKQLVGITVLACSDQFDLEPRPEYNFIPVQHDEEKLLVLFHRLPPSRELWEEIDREAEKRNIAIGGGRTYSDPSQLPDSYREALRTLRCALFLHLAGLIHFADLGELITTPRDLSEREEAIILSLRAGNYAGLMEQIDHFIDWIKSETIDPEIVEREMVKLLYLAIEASNESFIGNHREMFAPHVEIRHIHEGDKLFAWFREQFEIIIKDSLKLRENTKYAVVEQAKLYIENNASHNLSLQEVAEHVKMNPSYLSVLFKEVTGETYIKYITRYRMELAKKLLADGLKVNEVSEKVGYHTYRHFSEVFKKYTGLTPGKFKEKFESSVLSPDSSDPKKTDNDS